MPITRLDVNLDNFLANFTWTTDPNPDGRVGIDLALFLQIASILKVSDELRLMRAKK